MSAAEWLKRDQAKNRSQNELRRMLAKDVLPRWGERPIADIARRDALELLDGIADRGAVTLARRVHAHLHRMFRWAVGRGIIEANPFSDLPKPGKEVRRERVLTDSELVAVWRATEDIGWPFGHAARLLILTGARREEITALRWSEIDRQRNEILLKGERTKNGDPHTIPLSPAAIAMLDDAPRIDGSPYVFTTTGRTPVSGWSRAKGLLDEKAGEVMGVPLPAWRLHDLRRTVATGLQRLGVGLQVIEAVLGHVSGSRTGIVGVYPRHSFDDEKRAALDAWARYLEAQLSGAGGDNVVPLRTTEE